MSDEKVEFHALSMGRALELIRRNDPFFTKTLKEAVPVHGHFI